MNTGPYDADRQPLPFGPQILGNSNPWPLPREFQPMATSWEFQPMATSWELQKESEQVTMAAAESDAL